MIIVTGANRGLGKSIIDSLSKSGEDVLGLVRSKKDLKSNYIQCDITSYSSVKSAAKKVKKMKKPLKAFINVAGVASMNMAVTTDEYTVKNIIQTNLIGTIYCCQLFAPIMLRQKKGCFINFSTIAASLAIKGESIYAASKAGVETFSKSFAKEMADFNIRVNCIAPGPIKTDLLKGLTKTQIKDVISQQIFRKQFEKSDICDLIKILLNKKTYSLTGQILNVGGV